jgi:ribosomal-protein-alanine N-acetyltransferase
LIHIRNAREGEAELLSEIGLRAWQRAMASIGESDAMVMPLAVHSSISRRAGG